MKVANPSPQDRTLHHATREGKPCPRSDLYRASGSVLWHICDLGRSCYEVRSLRQSVAEIAEGPVSDPEADVLSVQLLTRSPPASASSSLVAAASSPPGEKIDWYNERANPKLPIGTCRSPNFSGSDCRRRAVHCQQTFIFSVCQRFSPHLQLQCAQQIDVWERTAEEYFL